MSRAATVNFPRAAPNSRITKERLRLQKAKTEPLSAGSAISAALRAVQRERMAKVERFSQDTAFESPDSIVAVPEGSLKPPRLKSRFKAFNR